jgi:hypothetical protein
MNDKKVELSLSLVQGILGYLGTKPYQETYQIIQSLQAQVIPQMPAQEAPESVQ